jgi:CheY-like chemotaxis protein/HPt (histidine-containing phosphotransfer) domain-containing protein/anti-sigma regulatory factor (Ser/Thr protein kinase)
MPSLINDTVTLNIMRKEEKPIEFKLTIDETLPSKLIGDELRIKQIFNNLLSNAFKYTKAGFVEWHITWEKSGDDIWLVSSVKDSGIGIREEDIQKLFQNYTQVDTKSHRKIEGTGLGLALTKRMVEQMDGSITVESEYGKGSKFSIRIKQGLIPVSSIGPAVAGKLQDFQYIDERQKRHAKLVRLQLPYARVLVVDDVPTNLDVVKGIMKPYGMKVDCASSGREAIKLVREGVKYNAIFMDQMMPEMDGLEATSIIRNEIDSEYAKTVPIIALTANAVIGNEELFLNSGFQAFLSKPIDITLMDAIIRQWVRDKDHNMLVEQIGNDSAGQVADNGIDGVDLDALLYQFGGEDDTLKMVLNSYAQNISTTLERVKAFDPEKVSDYATSVHGIKGVSRGICAEKVGALAEQLEKAGKAGDLTFIEANNAALIAAVEKLISDIKAWLG